VAYNGDGGGYLVVWEDYRSDIVDADVFGQRVNRAGNLVGSALVISSAEESEQDPALAASATSSGHLVAFRGGRDDDIVGQRVAMNGVLQGGELIISAPLEEQTRPSVAFNSRTSQFLVVWADSRSGTQDIWGQLVAADGTLVGNNFAIVSRAEDQRLPDVAYNSTDNQFLVVWEDLYWGDSDADIYGQRVDADGTLDGASVPVAITGAVSRRRPRVAYNPVSNEYLVVYSYEAGGDDADEVYGRLVPADSNPTETELEIGTGAADQNYPDVACRAQPAGGSYVVVWRHRDTTTDQRDVKGRRLSQSGFLQGSELDVCVQGDEQWSPRIAYSPAADLYLVVWPDDRNSATQGRDIYGRQISGAGVLYVERAYSTATEGQAGAAVAFAGGLGRYVVAWHDKRSDSARDLYGQQVDGDGYLVEATADTNEPLFLFSGAQEHPALAFGGVGEPGLAVWQDGRNGTDSRVYGLLISAHAAYLPLILSD
jgi:hypothetical protein